MVCNAVQFGESQMFWRNILSPPSGSEKKEKDPTVLTNRKQDVLGRTDCLVSFDTTHTT
jgi:hypothetical protein